MYLHCTNGLTRSPVMLLAWLVAYKNVTLYDALNFVTGLRPAVDLPGRALYQLADLEVLVMIHTYICTSLVPMRIL